MRNFNLLVATLCIAPALVAGCDHPYDGGDKPAVDPNAPVVHITSPERGAIAGNVGSVIVTGTATDDIGVTELTVNGVTATLAADHTFTATVPVTPGTNLLHAIAKDASNNEGKETRSVVAGPMAKLDAHVKNAITASMSAQTFDAIGRGAAGYIQTADLESLISASNPVYSAGAPNGPDCLYGQASITSISVGGTDISLVPQDGGLYLDAELDTVLIGMHLDYAAACLDGSRDITVGAAHISVSGVMAVGVDDKGAFDIHLDNPVVSLTGFDLELGGIPGAVVNLLHLDTAMGPIIGWATGKFVTPMLNKSLAGLGSTKTITALGSTVDISVTPSSIVFSDAGAIIELDTSMRARGDSGGPGFVNVANTTPAMDMTQGFQVDVAANAANELLASLWAAKGLDTTLDLKTGPYGDVGVLYDAVTISALAPPYVDATGDGLRLVVGDLMGSFTLAGTAVTKIAINAEVDVKVTADPTGALHLDVGNPTVYVDILDEGVTGANALSSAQFEALTSFALSRVVALGSGSVGAIPLPAIGGVTMSNVAIGEQTGYLVVHGDVQ